MSTTLDSARSERDDHKAKGQEAWLEIVHPDG